MVLPGIEQLGPARLVVTGRRGGVSRPPWDTLNLADHVEDDPGAVAENRRRVAAGLAADGVAVVAASHSSTVHHVAAPGTAPPGDILVTETPGLALLVLAADCVPALLVAPDVGAMAVVHAGWRGVALGAAGAAVAALADLGADAGQLVARIGPAICPGCYEVSAQVRDEVSAAAPPAAARTRSGSAAVDLAEGFVWQLQQAGVESVTVDRRCTFETDDLYSYRRDGRTGRHGLMAVMGER